MPKILVPVDGSEVSLRVVAVLLRRLRWYGVPVELHLVNVQRPVRQDVGQFVDHDALLAFHREEGLKLLAVASEAIQGAGIATALHVLLDDQPAAAICRFARERQFDEICMGSHGRGAMTHLLLGSVAADVVRQADLPVTLIK